MALPDFPNNPSIDDEFAVGAVVYKCTSVLPNPVWIIKTLTSGQFETVAAMKAAATPVGVTVSCKRYHDTSTPLPSLTYVSRGEGWPVVADGYVNHADSGGNFLELIYSQLDVKQAGAYANGTDIDTLAIQKSLDYLATLGGGELLLSKGVYKTETISVPTVNLLIKGSFAKLIPVTPATQICFNKTARGGFTEIRDLDFDGFYRGISIQMPTSETMYYDFLIVNCKFTDVQADGWGIYLDGPREGNIDKCYFESSGGGIGSGGGIYRKFTVNTNIRDSVFKELRFGIYDDGQGSPYSAGNHVLGCVMLGVNFGITAARGDSYLIDGCMIDYCDAPIRIFSQDGAKIVNNYLSSRTASPVIDIKKDPADAFGNFGIKIYNNTVITHYTAGQVNGIEIFDAQDSAIGDNYIQFFNYLGVRFKNCTFLTIEDNHFAPRPGSPYTTYCVANLENDSNTSNKIVNNSFQGNALNPTTMNVLARHNYGFVTQAAGIATLPSGATSVTVPHGMSVAPNIVLISPQANATFWWDLDGTTGINIRVAASTGSARQIAWAAYTTFALVN